MNRAKNLRSRLKVLKAGEISRKYVSANSDIISGVKKKS